MDAIRRILDKTIPGEWKQLICDQIDTIFVGAVGAARRIKMHLDDAWLHTDFSSDVYYLVSRTVNHDEYICMHGEI